MTVSHLCVGSLALNDTVYADGRTSMADPGGNALYGAVGANLWSNKVGLTAVVGYDWPPEYTETLQASAIETSALIKNDNETMRAWTIYEASGYRRYFSRNTEVVLLTPSPFSSTPMSAEEARRYSEAARTVHVRCSPDPADLPPALWNIDSLHLAPMRLETSLAWIEALEERPDIFVAVDILPYPLEGNLDDPDLLKILGRADAFMPSEFEVESLLPGRQPQVFCRAIAERGPDIVVVKQGDHGAVVYDRVQDFYTQILPFPAEVNDLTGAGDSFCGGFSIGYMETGNAVEAVLYGTVSASYVIEGFGGLHTLDIPRPEAEKRLARLREINHHVTNVTPHS